MPKFVISWDIGFGSKDHDVIEAADADAAQAVAYERWRQAAEDNADYEAQPYSKELAQELGLEDE